MNERKRMRIQFRPRQNGPREGGVAAVPFINRENSLIKFDWQSHGNEHPGMVHHPTCLSIMLIISFVTQTWSTTEWFGDLRAHMNPSRSPAFYDVVYDENDCPQGIESDAIPDYVYFGPMVATMNVEKHSDCVRQCITNSKCVAVNFFEPTIFQEKGFCELLSENQLDNPRLMRPFHQATYYENIKCRLDIVDNNNANNNHNENEQNEGRPPLSSDNSMPSKAELNSILKRLSAKIREFNLKYRQR